MIGVQPPEAPPERLKLQIPECAVTEAFRHYLLLRSRFGDPPYNPMGGLKAEHYAALAAEHERDPVLHELRRKASEQENPMAPAAEQGAPVGQDPAGPDPIGRDPVGQDTEQLLLQ